MSSKNSKVGAAAIARKTQTLTTRSSNNSRRRRNRRRRTRRSNRNFTRRLIGQIGQTQSVKICKRELWFTDTFQQGGGLVTKNMSFNTTDGPAWFKAMSKLYEKYKIHGVNLYIKFGGSMTTKGMYVLTYNSNVEKRTDNTKSFAELQNQKGAALITAARQTGAIHINGSSLTGYSTTLPTEGDAASTYCFNAVVAGVPPETVDFAVEIQYIVTFYNPTISN